MKSKYRKLKFSILLQTVFVTALTVLVGDFLLEYAIDGAFNDNIAEGFVNLFVAFDVPREKAVGWYWSVIGHNKLFFILLGFLVLFALFYYVSLSKLTKYLDQIDKGIAKSVAEDAEPVRLATELKPIENSLNLIKSKLRQREIEAVEAESKKNDMVVFLAHDLKTPLTSVVAYLSMLDAHPEMSEEERARYTHISLEKAIRLGELINEFFEITKFNLQDIELEKTEIHLTMMLEQIADELYAVLQEKNLTCELEVEENLIVNGDPDKLARVFDNILRNAISYCAPNSKLEISAKELEGGTEIVFANEGEPIPPNQLETIFEKFYRTDSSRSSTTGGAGLGLAIAKEIVGLHGGTIRAESDVKKTKFIVVLPKGVKDEVHTHSRRTFRGIARRRK